ncbi:hypothetical protein Taro_003099 [Colocasia esculenta]|uniref:SWIM-type domain-containing protein n=1 Tax=Colocasia esculenta TaxID=4460 RepID=A0A843TMY3_COLES|nr:hypothetical protein [Colocasia esculenta]
MYTYNFPITSPYQPHTSWKVDSAKIFIKTSKAALERRDLGEAPGATLTGHGNSCVETLETGFFIIQISRQEREIVTFRDQRDSSPVTSGPCWGCWPSHRQVEKPRRGRRDGERALVWGRTRECAPSPPLCVWSPSSASFFWVLPARRNGNGMGNLAFRGCGELPEPTIRAAIWARGQSSRLIPLPAVCVGRNRTAASRKRGDRVGFAARGDREGVFVAKGVCRGEIAKGVRRGGEIAKGGSPRRRFAAKGKGVRCEGFRREGEGGSLRRGFAAKGDHPGLGITSAKGVRCEGVRREGEGGSLRREITQVGPRICLNPIKIFGGSFGGPTLYENPFLGRANINRVPGIFTYKNDAYVIPIHRGMEISCILDDVCTRWTLMKDQVELKCRIPGMGNSVMKLLNGGDIDRIIDMHEIIGSKMINIEVHVFGSEEVLSIRASAEQSSVNNNIRSIVSGTLSQEMRLRSDLWHDVIHSTGQIFVSVEYLWNDLTKYAISRGFDFTFVKNDSTRVTVHCKIATCAWSLHANRIGLGPQFKIKSLNNVHTCGGGLSTQKHPRASKKWEKIVDAPLYRPKDIKKDIFREYGVDLPYHQAWLGKEVAYKEQFGDEICSFNELLWYKDAIERTNPGSVVELDVTNEGHFKRFFICYHACIVGFQKGCRPLLFLDVTFLKDKYQGKLLAATALNGQNELFPLAYVACDAKNEENWTWFLTCLKKAISIDRQITFIFDRCKGLLQAILYVFPNSHNAFCLRHLADNFAKYLRGKCSSSTKDALIEFLKKAAYVMTTREFEILTRPSHVVDLQVGECTCREWQVRRLPCKHVCAVAHKIRCNVEEYCSLYFSTQCYQSCYVETIKPISNKDKPLVDFENVEVKPPTTKRRAGRPKKNMIPSQQGLEEMNCDFFMWCDKVRSFVETTTTCEKDEKIKKLENKIAWLEDELRDSKSLINKAKGVVQSLPKTFTFLSILDKDGDDGSDGDSHSQEDMNVNAKGNN